MRKKAILAGIPEHKIRLMDWYIDFPKVDHIYSKDIEPLRIGYAGRITCAQKRTDLFKEIVYGLRAHGVKFEFQIAGSGDYEDELKEWVGENGNGEIIWRGLIPHEEIYDFWNRQDVYLSVSEWEGHSISQTEAMAMGAVPVVTDTSGVEDDIANGESGFIVDIGDIEGIVDKLELLFNDRNLLQRMGSVAGKSIRKKCNVNKEKAFWKDVFACLI